MRSGSQERTFGVPRCRGGNASNGRRSRTLRGNWKLRIGHPLLSFDHATQNTLFSYIVLEVNVGSAVKVVIALCSLGFRDGRGPKFDARINIKR